jgi:4-amino-4-deoxy-L-arabinose transferase-like glycosyltransferase
MLVSLASTVLAYLCGRLLFSEDVGLFAAFLWAILPIDIQLATTLLPDPAAALWQNTALLLLYVAVTGGSSSRARFFLSCLSGVAAGVSWLTKETILYAAPLFAAVALCGATKRRSALLWAAACALCFFGVLGIESWVYYSRVGDPLFRFHEMSRNYELYKSWFFAEGSRYGWKAGEDYHWAVVKRVLWTGPRTILFSTAFLGYTLIAALVAGADSAVGRRKRRLTSGWFLYLCAVFNFGSSALRGSEWVKTVQGTV